MERTGEDSAHLLGQPSRHLLCPTAKHWPISHSGHDWPSWSSRNKKRVTFAPSESTAILHAKRNNHVKAMHSAGLPNQAELVRNDCIYNASELSTVAISKIHRPRTGQDVAALIDTGAMRALLALSRAAHCLRRRSQALAIHLQTEFPLRRHHARQPW